MIGLFSHRDDEFSQIFERDDEEKLLDTFSDFLEGQGGPASSTMAITGSTRNV